MPGTKDNDKELQKDWKLLLHLLHQNTIPLNQIFELFLTSLPVTHAFLVLMLIERAISEEILSTHQKWIGLALLYNIPLELEEIYKHDGVELHTQTSSFLPILFDIYTSSSNNLEKAFLREFCLPLYSGSDALPSSHFEISLEDWIIAGKYVPEIQDAHFAELQTLIKSINPTPHTTTSDVLDITNIIWESPLEDIIQSFENNQINQLATYNLPNISIPSPTVDWFDEQLRYLLQSEPPSLTGLTPAWSQPIPPNLEVQNIELHWIDWPLDLHTSEIDYDITNRPISTKFHATHTDKKQLKNSQINTQTTSTYEHKNIVESNSLYHTQTKLSVESSLATPPTHIPTHLTQSTHSLHNIPHPTHTHLHGTQHIEKHTHNKPEKNYSQNIDPNISELFQKAFSCPLTHADIKFIEDEMAKKNWVITNWHISPLQFTKLLMANPSLAKLLIEHIQDIVLLRSYFDAIINMEISIPCIEIIHLFLLQNKLMAPLETITFYVKNCIEFCQNLDDGQLKSKLVRFICIFIQFLIRKELLDYKELLIELQTFCIEFSDVSEALALYRLISLK